MGGSTRVLVRVLVVLGLPKLRCGEKKFCISSHVEVVVMCLMVPLPWPSTAQIINPQGVLCYVRSKIKVLGPPARRDGWGGGAEV